MIIMKYNIISKNKYNQGYLLNMLTNSKSENSHRTVSNTAIICLSPYYGGMEMDAFRIAKLLCKNTNITLIVKKNSLLEKQYKTKVENLNIQVESINFFKTVSLSIVFRVRKIIYKNNIKNVIYFGASELKSLYFSFLGLKINLLIRHGTTKTRSKKDFLHRLIYSKVNFHIAICEHLAKNVKKIIPFGKNTQLNIIYSSLRKMPSDIRNPQVCKDRPVSLLHLARITDGKGQIDAIEACHVLYKMKKDFTLRLVGDINPDYEEKFFTFLNKIPYKESIILEGFTSNVAQFYRNADIFIFPSKGEGLSNSFIEALSYGLACISYNNTSFPELSNLGFDFFMAEDQNIDSLKKILQSTVKYIESNPVPISKNITLSEKLFYEERELHDFINILM